MFAKPKCVWKAVVYLENCKQTAEKSKQIFENCQRCSVSVLEPFISDLF